MDLPVDDDGMSVGDLMGVAPVKVEVPPPVVAAVSGLPADVEEELLTTNRQKRRLGAEKHVVKLFVWYLQVSKIRVKVGKGRGSQRPWPRCMSRGGVSEIAGVRQHASKSSLMTTSWPSGLKSFRAIPGPWVPRNGGHTCSTS